MNIKVNGTTKIVPMSIYPTKDSLNEAMEYAYSLIPVESQNVLHGVIAVYHNTLLKEMDISK